MRSLSRNLFLLFSSFILFFLPGYAQNIIKAFTKEYSVEIKSITAVDSFNDLEPLGLAIGDARIVLLGEQSHGDGAAFQAKSRIVQYLHQQKGFDVLVFESDFFSLQQGLKNEGDSLFLRTNIFPQWTWCNACSDLLYRYIPSTYQSRRPLTVTGMDPQLHGDYAIKNISADFDLFLKQNFAEDVDVLNVVNELSKDIDSLVLLTAAKDTITCLRIINNLDKLLKSEKLSSSITSQWFQYLRNFRTQAKVCLAQLKKKPGEYHLRDRQMAENIDWLLNHSLKGKKIIVWAHNYHISKNSFDRFEPAAGQHRSMGSFLAHEFNREKEMYILGFTSYQGFTDWTNSDAYDQTLRKPDKNGFENWIPQKWQFAFTDFKKYNIDKPGNKESFRMKGSTYLSHASTSMQWTTVYDGIFFIRHMSGCVKR